MSLCDSQTWRVVVDATSRFAQEQMRYDEQRSQEGLPSLRLFRWRVPAISLGYRQPVPAWCNASLWDHGFLEKVTRPTGGGIAFHGSDVCVSIVVPRGVPVPLMWGQEGERSLPDGGHLSGWMKIICEITVQRCRRYGVAATTHVDAPSEGRITYCLTQKGPYAVMVEGRKIAGFAIRRYPQSWLIQGSLLVNHLPQPLLQMIPSELLRQLKERSISLSEAINQWVDEEELAAEWAEDWLSLKEQTV